MYPSTPNTEPSDFWQNSESETLHLSGKITKTDNKRSDLAGSKIGPRLQKQKAPVTKKDLENIIKELLSNDIDLSNTLDAAIHYSSLVSNKRNPKEQLRVFLNLFKMSLESHGSVSEEQRRILKEDFNKSSEELIKLIDNIQFHGSISNDRLKAVIAGFLISLI